MTTALMSAATWPVVAGIPFRVHAPDGVELAHWTIGDWQEGAGSEEPITLRYSIGDTQPDGLRALVASAVDDTGSYLLDGQGELAVRASAVQGAAPQLLLTRRAGYEYEIRYARAADLTTLQWKWPRNVFGYALATRQRGLVCHACGVRLANGRGVLVPGCSGDGKSTFGRTLVDADLGIVALSDDRIALTGEPSGVRLWGTPWYSSAHLSASGSASLSAIVFPARGGDAPSVRRLTRTEAARRLMRTLGYPVWSAALMPFALDLTARIAATAPAFEIAYTPNGGAAGALHVHLERIVEHGADE